jgi:putative YhdH/YhfP family quinone oxidoreductase
MLAIDLFSRAGFEVHAISGKADRAAFLEGLGAAKVLDRHELALGARPLESVRFGGALDNVGGAMLAQLLAGVAPYGNVASVGLAADSKLDATVMPFIIRGVSLLGVASAGSPRPIREQVWEHLASDWKPAHLDVIANREVTLSELPPVFDTMLAGGSLGRTVVRVA